MPDLLVWTASNNTTGFYLYNSVILCGSYLCYSDKFSLNTSTENFPDKDKVYHLFLKGRFFAEYVWVFFYLSI